MVGRDDQCQRFGTMGRKALQRRDRDGRRGVAAGRLENPAAIQPQGSNVGSHASGVFFRGNQIDRRVSLRARHQAAQCLHQHRAVAGKIVELLRIVLARQRPQPGADAAAHYETDDALCHVPRPLISECLVLGAGLPLPPQDGNDRLEHFCAAIRLRKAMAPPPRTPAIFFLTQGSSGSGVGNSA